MIPAALLLSLVSAAHAAAPSATDSVDGAAPVLAEAEGAGVAAVAPPRQPLDYTAWTLEQGEVRLGLTRLDVGVLPRVALSTQTGLDALGIFNAGLSWAPIDNGRTAVALGATYHELPLGDFSGRHTRLELGASRQISRLGLHGTLGWTHLTTSGSPDASKLSPVLTSLLGVDREELQSSVGDDGGGDDGVDVDSRTDTIRLNLATDVRLSEHHALVTQVGMALVQDKHVGEELAGAGQALSDDLGLARALDPDSVAGPGDTYVASIAWQGSWNNLQLRAGLGLSADPYAWLLPSTELSWRFGGKKRTVDASRYEG